MNMMEHNPAMAQASGVRTTKAPMYKFVATNTKGMPTRKGSTIATGKRFVKKRKIAAL